MSLNRIKYDKDAADLHNKRMTDPGLYMLYPGYPNHCEECTVEKGPRNSRSDVSAAENLGTRADIESKLQNRHVPLNEGNNKHDEYLKHKGDLSNKAACENFNNTSDEYSRFSHPLSDYRGMSTLKNHITPYLHVNPQTSSMNDDDLRKGSSTRLTVKSTFKTKEPTMIDNGEALPKGSESLPVTTSQCKQL
jgi:hypothetical protein